MYFSRIVVMQNSHYNWYCQIRAWLITMPFMRNTFIFLSLYLVLLMQGCAVYDGVAYFHDSGEILEVKIDKHLRTKAAYVEARGENGVFCSGALRTAHASKSLHWWTCKGEDGKFTLACNDGRHLSGVWNAENCSTGQAIGGDQYGNTFVLAYADTREEALRKTGAGPGAARPVFYGGPVSPFYSSLLTHDGEGAMLAVAPAQERENYGGARSVAGFFISSDGRIATSRKGLGKNDRVSVYLPAEGRELPARVLSIDPAGDVVILKVEAEGEVGAAVRVIIRK